MKSEIWKPIQNYNGLYEISNLGNIKSLKKKKLNNTIIEEPKKIEKITVREKTLGFPNGEWTARNMDKAFAIKINELIDEIKILKEKKDE